MYITHNTLFIIIFSHNRNKKIITLDYKGIKKINSSKTKQQIIIIIIFFIAKKIHIINFRIIIPIEKQFVITQKKTSEKKLIHLAM